MRRYGWTYKLLAVFILVVILLQTSLLQRACIAGNRKYYYKSDIAIINTEANHAVLSYADQEAWRKASRLLINRMYTTNFVKSCFLFYKNQPFKDKIILTDVRKEISDFTTVYFFGSKYKSTFACCLL
ncbi:MAG TPA: hypothetical protein PK733_01820 [Clostridiales bacterium]|nr:hypothetical protein [Clostridiales bacterium]